MRAAVDVVPWPETGRPSAAELARAIDGFARANEIRAVSIDGPQAWRDPRRPPSEGVGRACERATRTPGKTGAGRTFPENYLAWTTLSLELFAALRALPGVEVADSEDARAASYLVLECFPTSTWRSLGLTPLPAKARRPDLARWRAALRERIALEIPADASHDELQAVLAALPAAALLGGPLRAVAHGVPSSSVDGVSVEGLIWDAAVVTALPLLVVVSGPPAAGKTMLAEALRDRLRLPLIAKDTLKETLGEHIDVARDRTASRRLGVATFAVQFSVARELLTAGVSLILEGNFRADWFSSLPPARVVQVHLTAAPAVLRERLLARDTHRHPVHYDREAAAEIAERAAEGEWDPLPIGGELTTVDTTASWPDTDEIAARVEHASARRR